MCNKPEKIVAALEKYLDPRIPPSSQGLPTRRSPNQLLFHLAGDSDEPIGLHIIRVDEGFQVGVILGGGSTYYHGSPVFIDTEESAQKMLEWIRFRVAG